RRGVRAASVACMRTGAQGEATWLAEAIAAAPVAIWSTDRDLRVTGAFGGLDFGGERVELFVGSTVQDLATTPSPTDAFVAPHLAALAGKKQAFRVTRGGRCYEVRLAPLGHEGEPATGVCGFAVDVTDRERGERALTE